jgi:aerobic-type carbon monoxide dehydrogenase small subunit (CoxS/CutS family)
MTQHALINLIVNSEPTEVAFAPYKTLLEVLREDLNLCGTKHGCELGECGACAVLLDDEPVLSCLVLGVDCGGRRVTTVEGLATDARLHPLQDAFADLGAAQCGYCTPGFLVTAKALLDEHPRPTRDQIKAALSGNLCRCTGYQQIFEAVELAVQMGSHNGQSPQTEIQSARNSSSEKHPTQNPQSSPSKTDCSANSGVSARDFSMHRSVRS